VAGEILKKAREESGADINEVSDALKIRPEYLSAIENDSFDQLPVAVYTIGYIRCYAKYLCGVEAEPVNRFRITLVPKAVDHNPHTFIQTESPCIFM
jgi:cytoskeletal protein RodZ